MALVDIVSRRDRQPESREQMWRDRTTGVKNKAFSFLWKVLKSESESKADRNTKDNMALCKHLRVGKGGCYIVWIGKWYRTIVIVVLAIALALRPLKLLMDHLIFLFYRPSVFVITRAITMYCKNGKLLEAW